MRKLTPKKIGIKVWIFAEFSAFEIDFVIINCFSRKYVSKKISIKLTVKFIFVETSTWLLKYPELIIASFMSKRIHRWLNEIYQRFFLHYRRNFIKLAQFSHAQIIFGQYRFLIRDSQIISWNSIRKY